MEIREVMTSKVQVCRPSDGIQVAAMKMKDYDIGAIPIVENDQRVVGILTDRDIVIRGLIDPKFNVSTMTCRELMTSDVISVYADADVHEVANLMAEQQIRRLPIVDNQNRLVGICSIGDLAVEHIFMDEVGQALSDISKPETTVH